MRVGRYRRVSTDMQVEEGFSLEAQRIRLDAYAESQGWTIVEDYCDEGFSAKNTDRPEMQRLINDIKQKKFDVVLVYRLDRFVRSVLDLHELLQLMEKHDVKFKSATEIFDTTSATGRLFITMIATLAQWERETIAERTHMGMTKKSEQGERNGAPAPYGYDLIESKLVLNSEQAKWVKYIYNRYGSVGSQTIAKELNGKGIRTKKNELWSDYSVRYILKNPLYSGFLRWNYETYMHGIRKKTGEEIVTKFTQPEFEPIIEYDNYVEVQELLKRRSTDAFRSDNFYPFSGIAKCERCGYSFTGAFKKLKNGNIHRFYKCRGRINMGVCDVQAIAEDVIEEAFLNVLDLAETDIEISTDAPIFNHDDIHKQLERINRKKERTEELYLEGDIPKDRYNTLMAEARAEEVKYHELLGSVEETQSHEEVKEYLKNLKQKWFEFSHEARKQAVHGVFESVTIRLVEKAIPPHTKAKIEIADIKVR